MKNSSLSPSFPPAMEKVRIPFASIAAPVVTAAPELEREKFTSPQSFGRSAARSIFSSMTGVSLFIQDI